MKFSKLLWLFTVVASISLIFGGCKIEVSDTESKDPYTREEVSDYASNELFGKGRLDFDYVALNYIYNNEQLIHKYGEGFVVEDPGGSSDNTTFFGLTKGTATYSVVIEDDSWTVIMSKGYFGKWEVTDCYQQNAVEQ